MNMYDNRCLGYVSHRQYFTDDRDSIVYHQFRDSNNCFFIWGHGTVDITEVKSKYFAIVPAANSCIYIPSLKSKLLLEFLGHNVEWASDIQKDTIWRTRTDIFLSFQFERYLNGGEQCVKITNINILEPDHANYQELLAISTSPEHISYLRYHKSSY